MNRQEAQQIRDIAHRRNQSIDMLQREYSEYSKYLKYSSEKAYTTWGYIWRICLPIACLIYLFKNSIYSFFSQVVVMLLIASIVFLVLMIIKTQTYNEELNRLKVKAASFKNFSKRVEDDINSYTKQLESYDMISPYYYCVADVILNYIVIGRADTVKEAINLFEFEQRQDAQFRMQMQQLQQINNTMQKNGLINAMGFATLGAINIAGFSSINSKL